MSETRVADRTASSPPISDHDFASVQRYVDAIIDKMAEHHLSVVIERDFLALYNFLKSRRGAFVYPTFNPYESNLGRESFWLRVVDADGATVASHAQRVFVVDDFCSLIRSGSLWFALGTPMDPERTELTAPGQALSGCIAHAGSLWVDPEHRKKGLSVWLPYLSRLACLRNYSPDFFSALVFEKMATSGVPAKFYGYTHVEPILRGFFPPTGTDEHVFLCYMNCRDAIDKIRLLAVHPEYPVDPDAPA